MSCDSQRDDLINISRIFHIDIVGLLLLLQTRPGILTRALLQVDHFVLKHNRLGLVQRGRKIQFVK